MKRSIYNYTFPLFRRGVKSLVKDIRFSARKYDIIVGIGRGSCSLAQVLSHKLNTELKILNWSRDGDKVYDGALQEDIIEGKSVLFVDEIIDSGDTMIQVLESIAAPREWWGDVRNRVHIATLVWNTANHHHLVPDFHYSMINRNKTKRYVNFWWEKM